MIEMKRRVVVTGLGAVTPIGNTAEAFWAGVRAGKVGIGPITKFDTTDYKVKIAAEVKDFDPKSRLDAKAARRMELFSQYAVAAALEAVENASLSMEAEDPYRVGVIVGSGVMIFTGRAIGMTGRSICLAYLGASIWVICMGVPIILLSYLCTGSMMEMSSLTQLHLLLVQNGWTWVTALCMMLFSLMHFPCGTTCWTIYKETKSVKWTLISFAVPTVIGMAVCLLVASLARLSGLV